MFVGGDRCSVCDGVYHEATGHRLSDTHRWCGPCTRDFIQWLKGQQKRKWGGIRFYDHARVPPKLSST